MKYHFIGIKGAGMSSLAQIMHDLGYEVQGSDVTHHLFTQNPLEERKISMLPFDPSNINKDMSVVVGGAFGDENPEVSKTKELGIESFSYFQLLGQLTKEYETIAICGCHGKTTTTSLAALVFNNIVGANYLIGDGTGYAKKGNKYFIIEACEHKRNFLHYYPQYIIITNIELDHVDYYKDLEDVKSAFFTFGNKADKMIIACGDDENIRSINFEKPIIYYGFNDNNDVIAKNVILNNNGSSFDVYMKGEFLGHFDLPIYGRHMILNTLSIIAISQIEGLNITKVAELIKTFKGAKRRFKEKIIGDNVLIDDYAHHPTEIRVTIESARQKYPDKKIIAIFLPHTSSRVKILYKDFAKSLNLADKAYVMEVFNDRKEALEWQGVSSKLIVDLLNNGEFISDDTIDKLLPYRNAVLIFMSSKEIYYLQDKYEQLLVEANKVSI